MKKVRDVIRRPPVWVNPEHTAESAIWLMRGHGIGGLPVLDGRELVGIVLYSHLLGAEPSRQVGDVMTPAVPTLDVDMPVREAAALMAEAGFGRLPVMDGGRLVGVVTDGDLLPEIGRSADPLTGLPWVDALREWAILQLSGGNEITVLFADVDRFGQFNKVYGHIVGDEVLKGVAAALRACTDPETDVLCRFGGDEFCIATLRLADQATALAERVAECVAAIDVPGIAGEHIACCVGLHGGKRTREREHVHYAATVNNLINLASRDCTARKLPTRHAAVRQRTGTPGAPRLRLGRVSVVYREGVAEVSVSLEWAGGGAQRDASAVLLEGLTTYSASTSAPTAEEGVPRLVAETTASAVQGLLPEGYGLSVTDVQVTPTSRGQTLVSVVGEWAGPAGQIAVAGSALAREDPMRAAAAAVLAASNRPLGLVLALP